MVKKIHDDLFECLFYQGKNKGKKKKINLRQSPFHLQDGDVIGVKVTNVFPRKVYVNLCQRVRRSREQHGAARDPYRGAFNSVDRLR